MFRAGIDAQRSLLILTTSNASRSYFTDAFQVLAWPRGWIAHFRYQLQWLTSEFADTLPLPDHATNPSLTLRGKRLIIAYMFQEASRSSTDGSVHRSQVALYPLRYGTILNAFRVGNERSDIAHFYFSLDGFYIRPSNVSTCLKPSDILPANIFVDSIRFPVLETDSNSDESAFYRLVDSMDPKHLVDASEPNAATAYYPVAAFIRGLSRRNHRSTAEAAFVDPVSRQRINPKFEWSGKLPYYELSERHEYLFDFSYYIPKWAASPAAGSTISLTSDEQVFATPNRYSIPAESRYDEHSWLLASGATERNVWRNLVFTTDIQAKSGNSGEVANLSLNFSIVIKPDVARRAVTLLFDVCGDVGLAVGTVALAFIKNPPEAITSAQLILGAIVGYTISIASKVVARFLKP